MLVLHDNLKHPVTYHESHSHGVPLHTKSVYSLPVIYHESHSCDVPLHSQSVYSLPVNYHYLTVMTFHCTLNQFIHCL